MALMKTRRTTGALLRKGIKRKALRTDYDDSIRTGRAVWARPEMDLAAEARKDPGRLFENEVDDILLAKRTSNQKPELGNAPFDEERNAAAG